MFLAPIGIYGVESPITALESILDEGGKYAVFFLSTVKERTDMALIAELGAGEVNGGGARTYGEIRRRKQNWVPDGI